MQIVISKKILKNKLANARDILDLAFSQNCNAYNIMLTLMLQKLNTKYRMRTECYCFT